MARRIRKRPSVKRSTKEPNKVEIGMHVAINSPLEMRREILESAISSAEILQHYEKIKEIKHRKLQYRKRLKKVLSELKFIAKELDNELPKVKIQEDEKPKRVAQPKIPSLMPPTPPKIIKQVIKKPQREAHKSKLETDLEELKRRLSKL
ncbi:MAG: hypothetical protein HYS32_00980 [Candidatus Woesearchaeota archaeon]|nr:MAG: hypothetical protein HYS32_00980 [Candidatus Woesearchaeota archaeon]